MTHKHKHILYVLVRIEVVTELEDVAEIVSEFESDTDYSFGDTDNLTVIDTEFLSTELIHPDNSISG